jgi:hypothetical protein
MPPVIEESRDDVAYSGTPKEGEAFSKMKERGFLKPTIPSVARKNKDTYLNGINDQNAKPPSF